MRSPLPPDTDIRSQALEIALKRLAVRETSRQELEGYLVRKEIPAAIAAETVERLAEEKLLDERRYAREVTRSEAMREKGPEYILQKLQQKGVRIELNEVREVFGEASAFSELDLARHFVERRYPRAEKDEKEFRKAYTALVRRGFSSDVVRAALFGRTLEETE